VVPFEIVGIASGRTTRGHRFMSSGDIEIASADDYANKLRAARVILSSEERQQIIQTGARAAAKAAGLELIEDDQLLAENAGLTEWPVPLLGRFEEDFLTVPPEAIQLAMKTHQKYFAVGNPPPAGEGDRHGEAAGGGGGTFDLTNAFVCTANIEAPDGGAEIVAGNEKVLAARLADARFFWDQDRKTPLETHAGKLKDIVFHEKLGTVADKVERVAKLARWLVEEGIVGNPNITPASVIPAKAGIQSGTNGQADASADSAGLDPALRRDDVEERATLADQAERAARLAKADLVTGMVSEFPELQGIMGGHYARAQGEDAAVADAIRDHYKPVGQGDDVPTAPVTVAVSLADKLDSLFIFFAIGQKPSGSKDPFALRRQGIAILSLLSNNSIRLSLLNENFLKIMEEGAISAIYYARKRQTDDEFRRRFGQTALENLENPENWERWESLENEFAMVEEGLAHDIQANKQNISLELFSFLTDRLKVQQREAGVRHDLIDAVFALGGEDDIVRLLARVKALQAFMETDDGASLLTGYKRAANILKKEKYEAPDESAIPQDGEEDPLVLVDDPQMKSVVAAMNDPRAHLGYDPDPAEAALVAALDEAEPRAKQAVAEERFADAMTAIAALRAPIDDFFDNVTVVSDDETKKQARLALLARITDAAHQVADFSKIEG
ncbi:MAG: glycine--tRNA ligase subunit beta, partial [Pacificimonas sp.]